MVVYKTLIYQAFIKNIAINFNHNRKGNIMSIDEAINILRYNNKRVCDLSNEDLQQLAEWLTQLKEYQKLEKCLKEELEKQGGLIKLPCSVGDTVYRIKLNKNACSKCKYLKHDYYEIDFCGNEDVIDIAPQCINKPLCKKHFYEIEPYCFQDIDDIFNKRKEFGKTIFFTKKEAKAKIDIHLLVEMDKATRKYIGSAIDKWIKKEEKAKIKTLQEEND